MNKELHGICKFLLERGKRELVKEGEFFKLYFIMRYPENDKPVYSPIKNEDLIDNLGWSITQRCWNKRRQTNPPGTRLLAVCTCQAGYYNYDHPLFALDAEIDRPVILCTFHMESSHIAYASYFTHSNNEYDFEPVFEFINDHMRHGCGLYPKNL
jgi:hypothetical protein